MQVPFRELGFNKRERLRFLDERVEELIHHNTYSDLPGFTDKYLDLPDEDSILCVAYILTLPLQQQQTDAFWLHTSVLLVLSPDSKLSPKEICATMRPWDEGLNRGALSYTCQNNPEWILARAYLDESCAWQFYGQRDKLQEVKSILTSRGINGFDSYDELNRFLWQYPNT